MIVVTLTSWVKRINNVKTVVESVMKNTLQPDRLYLNLSKTEFEGIDLPKDLVDYFQSDERLIINWVEGENTKTMKKVFPILKYLSDDDIIINIDDDALIPIEFIRNRYNEFIRKKSPITSCNNPKYHYINKVLKIWSCGAGSIFQKKMLNGYDKFMNDELIKSFNDDWCYTTLLWLNGYRFIPCDSYSMQNGSINTNNTKLQKYNEIDPMGKRHGYIDNNNMYKLLEKRIYSLFNIYFDKSSFNLFNNRHDCVMVYGKSGIDSKEMTCGKYLEIEYVIASIKKFCKSWCGRIFIVGSEPPKSIQKDVIHIPCDNPYTHCKDANIIHKLRYACENISDLSDDFLMISDDQIVTKNSSWEDMKPRIVRKYTDWTDRKWQHNRTIDKWHEYLYNTLQLFPKNTRAFWEPHIWSPINKHKFVEMCKKYDYQKCTDCITQSLYYNFIKQPIVKQFDHTHLAKSNKILSFINTPTNDRHLSWTDNAFKNKQFRDILNKIVGFDKENNSPTPQPVIPKNSKSKLRQIKEDIKNGKLKKVFIDGKYTWKRYE